MQRSIKNVVVLGSGVMGSRIACHFAGVGVKVLLLDRLTPGTEASEVKKERNKLVDDSLTASIKSNPSPLYNAAAAKLIATGNFTDDISKIANADWIIEVVVERLDIKKQIYEEVEKYSFNGGRS
jgi:3-hydroxyacyl-CoA dehydrogenase